MISERTQPMMDSKSYSKMNDDEKRWQAEDDLRALSRVAEIKADKARHRRALDLAKKKISELQKVKGKA